MGSLVAPEDLATYREGGRRHTFTFDFRERPVSLPQAILLYALRSWQGNRGSGHFFARDCLSLLVRWMRREPLLREVAARMPMTRARPRGRGEPGGRFDYREWGPLFEEKRREGVVTGDVGLPSLTAEGYLLADDLANREVGSDRFSEEVREFFRDDEKVSVLEGLLEQLGEMSPRVLAIRLHAVIR
ncbi:MAG: hypothetical protein HQL57_03695 [Magnetococcales bacterium]|nr:hypothetical protein [Magnetococcales bacterium]MBF0156272.1 hypothetical protein [Magnetococcales bacterium]